MRNNWFDKLPDLIISVNGALDRVILSEKKIQMFQKNLIYATSKMKAYILTAGTNNGVMRIVGDAVKRNLKACDLNIIGISTWNCIRFKDKLLVNKGANLKSALKTNFLI